MFGHGSFLFPASNLFEAAGNLLFGRRHGFWVKGMMRSRFISGRLVFLLVLSMIPVAAPTDAAEWRLTPSISASETFTDNEDLRPNGQKDPALVTQITPGIGILGTGARLNVALNSSLSARYQAINDNQMDVDVNLAGTANAEVVRDLFFIDAAASISQEALDDRAATSASSANRANLDTVQTYTVSPYLRHRLGNFADAEERYSFTRSDQSGGTISDSITHTVRFSLTSGRDFTQLLWNISASATKEQESDDENELERRADVNLEYVVDRHLSVLGSAGFEDFDFGAGRAGISEPTWSAGLRIRPGPKTEIQGTFGRRFGGQSINASLRHDITSRTSLTVSVATTLDEPQSRFSRDLSFISVDAQGNLIDARTGQPFSANTNALGFSNERQRTTTYTATLSTTRGRNAFTIAATRQNQEGLFSGVEDNSTIVNASWNRQLSRKINLATSASYERSEFGADNRDDNEYTGRASLNYRIFENASANLSYTFRRRESTNSASEFTENTVTLGASYSF